MAAIKILDRDKARITFYSIRERMAWHQLAKLMSYDTVSISEDDGNDSWDVIYDNHGKRTLAEIKVRKKLHTYRGPDNLGFIFEKKKFIELKQSQILVAKRLNLNIYFIVFFIDKVCIWDIDKIKEQDFVKKMYKKTSVTGNDEIVEKEVTYLEIKDAEIIDYQLDFIKLNAGAREVFLYRYPKNNKDILDL